MFNRRVFISYRREDSSGYAGRLYDQMAGRFGEDNVFMDVAALKPGVDYEDKIKEFIGSSDIVLAVIGKKWLKARGPVGRRLDDPNDLVRRELDAALRGGCLVIPVLLQGARMPSAEALPENLQRLARLQAVELTDQRWKEQVEELAGQVTEAAASKLRGSDWAVRGKRPKGEEAKPFYRQGVWWLSLPVVGLLSVGSALLVAWLLPLVVAPFGPDVPSLRYQSFALPLAGLVWAVLYVVVGVDEFDYGAESAYFAPFVAYAGLSDGLAGFIRGVFSGLPTNLLLSWGIAHGIAFATSHYLGADYQGVVYVVFGAITLASALALLVEVL